MKALCKGVKKIFVDSDHFYRYNQKFFIGLILFELFQAMVFNSCSDIPTLFMLLALFASYAYRKVYTRAFLQYTFLLVYFIQLVLTLKIINETLVRIDYIREQMGANQDYRAVQVNTLLFGFKFENKDEKLSFK